VSIHESYFLMSKYLLIDYLIDFFLICNPFFVYIFGITFLYFYFFHELLYKIHFPKKYTHLQNNICPLVSKDKSKVEPFQVTSNLPWVISYKNIPFFGFFSIFILFYGIKSKKKLENRINY